MENRQSLGEAMSTEDDKARLTLLISPALKESFEAACSAQDKNCSQVVRRLIEDYLRRYGGG